MTPPQPIFDDAVIAAAKAFAFEPGTYGGKPVPVEITFTHTFLPPPPPPPPPPPARPARRERRCCAASSSSSARARRSRARPSPRWSATSTTRSTPIARALPAAAAAGRRDDHRSTRQPTTRSSRGDRSRDKQELAVTYFVERDRYDPYEIVVVGEQRREEVSRITLRGPEIQQIPGTFGDPFRVIQTLPGVASVVSLLPFPVDARREPELDRLPARRHARPAALSTCSSGPASSTPSSSTRSSSTRAARRCPTAATPAASSTAARARAARRAPDRPRRQPAAGRRPRARADQADRRDDDRGRALRLPGLPARRSRPTRPRCPTGTTSSASTAAPGERLDGVRLRRERRARHRRRERRSQRPEPAAGAVADPRLPPARPALPPDERRARDDVSPGARATTTPSARAPTSPSGAPSRRVRSRWKQSDKLTLAGGRGGRRATTSSRARRRTARANALSAITSQLDNVYVGSAFVEALWRPTPRLADPPGRARRRLHRQHRDQVGGRSAARPCATSSVERDLPDVAPGSDDSAIWLKARVGIYHQPPRFVLPLPGLDMMPLKYGLLQSYQTSLGVEIPLEQQLPALDRGLLQLHGPDDLRPVGQRAARSAPRANTTLVPTHRSSRRGRTAQQIIDRLTDAGDRARLRRRDPAPPPVEERRLRLDLVHAVALRARCSDGSWVAYDFDRTHLVNLVAGLPLRRNWDLGVRLQYQSGLPATTTAGYNAARADGYLRFDLRVDKRAVWQQVAARLLRRHHQRRAAARGGHARQHVIRYVLPTVGLRGRF